MNRLFAELQRLYFRPGQPGRSRESGDAAAGDTPAALDLVGPGGLVRTMAVDFAKAADWELAARLYEGVQADLELPAPVISVSGKDGYRVWFSLAAPVPLEQARGFLDGLHRRYLADTPLARLGFHPDAGASAATGPGPIDLPPALHAESGKWSAFIDPAMGSMFADEPGLEMAPNLDKQADLLAGFESIAAGDFQRVLSLLLVDAETADSTSALPGESPGGVAGDRGTALAVGGNFTDPKSFLLAVMNDTSASASLRIRAAEALLPYFEKPRTQGTSP